MRRSARRGDYAGVSSVYGWIRTAGSQAPLEAAEVMSVLNGAATTTDETGLFAFPSLAPGVDTLIVSHLGYTSRRIPIEVFPDRSVRVLIDVAVEAIELDPIKVEVRGSLRARRMLDFQRRRELRSGVFLTERELEIRGGEPVAHFLQGLPSVKVTRDGALGDFQFRFRGQRCRPRVWIDGREARPPGAGVQLLGELRGSDLETLEIYAGARPRSTSRVPAG